MMEKRLKIILWTLFFEMVSFGLLIPITPFIIQGYWVSDLFVWIAFSIYSIGTFFWGMYFGRLSDRLWRKKVLLITIFIHIIWYLVFSFAGSILIFLLARLIAWVGSSGISVAQAYIADISTPENRVKNMGLMGAVFGLGFLFGPVIWGTLAGFSQNLNFIGIVSAALLLWNYIVVHFFLEESVVMTPEVKPKDTRSLREKFKAIDTTVLAILGVSFITAFGFSGMQSTFPLVMDARFEWWATEVWYLLGFIWVCSVLYQAIWINQVRKILDEKKIILFWLICLGISFILFGQNQYLLPVFFIIPFFSIWYGSINPAIGALLSKLNPKNMGTIMWYNTSSMSLGNIFGPFAAAGLYVLDSSFPYDLSAVFFAISFIVTWFLIKNK